LSLDLERKKEVVSSVSEILEKAQTVVIAEYNGVKVEKMTKLRANARGLNVYLHVLKNTLARRAVTGTKFAPLANQMIGPLMYSISEDPVAAAKVIQEFAKENEAVKIIAGMFNEKQLNAAEVKLLAAIPSRDELLSQVMGVMQQIPASFVRCVAAIKAQKEVAA
jgi:large subunit ribosomal protein L10